MYYHRIDMSEGNDPTKHNRRIHDLPLSLFNHGFKFRNSVCNSCHDLTMSRVNISNSAIMTIKNVNYCCIIHNTSKSDTIN